MTLAGTITAKPEIGGTAHARSHPGELPNELAKGRAYEVVNDSKPAAIILGVERYSALLEQMEDIEDGLAVLEGKLGSKGESLLDWEESKAEFWALHPEADV
ncbi:MAG: hypothetical protein Q8O86_00270 [Dehalococcoidia bacterium]|nr:hypothetical protein [Dehalococcoidia bacterium]